MYWVPITLYYLMLVALSCFGALLPVVIIQVSFDSITTIRTSSTDENIERLKKEIANLDDGDLKYALDYLLDERKKARWWKFSVWFLISCILYVFMNYKITSLI